MREQRLSLITPGQVVAPTGLVGRDHQLAAAEEVLEQSSVQVVGMPGTGVSALLDVLAHRQSTRGRTVLRVTVSPWNPTGPLAQLDSLLPHLDAPTVVLDDAQHWAREAVHELLGATSRAGGRVVLGVHPGELSDLDVVHLPGLSRDAVRQLVEQSLGRPLAGPGDEALLAGLARTTRGHVSHLRALLEPDTLEPLVEVAARRPDLDLLREEFADALAESVQASLSTLDEHARLAVAVVAVAGPYAPAALVDAAAGTRQLADARESGLLERTDGGHRFRHAAVRDLVRRSAPLRILTEARWRIAVAAQATGVTHAPPGVLRPH